MIAGNKKSESERERERDRERGKRERREGEERGIKREQILSRNSKLKIE